MSYTERESELLNKIKKIQKKLEEESNGQYEITIRSTTNQNPITFGSLIKKTVQNTPKMNEVNSRTLGTYVVDNMPQFKELEDMYESIDEFMDVCIQYCKVHRIKPYISIDIEKESILYGKERPQMIGRIRRVDA